MEAAILSLDIGTTMTKAVLFDLLGRELSVVEKIYKRLIPHPGWVELDPEEIWGAILQVMGRNIWEPDDPQAMTAALSALIHEDVSVEKAISIWGRK